MLDDRGAQQPAAAKRLDFLCQSNDALMTLLTLPLSFCSAAICLCIAAISSLFPFGSTDRATDGAKKEQAFMSWNLLKPGVIGLQKEFITIQTMELMSLPWSKAVKLLSKARPDRLILWWSILLKHLLFRQVWANTPSGHTANRKERNVQQLKHM